MSLPYFNVLSPVPGEGIYYHLTGGYASLTPGYYHITPNGVSIRIPPGFYNRKEMNTYRKGGDKKKNDYKRLFVLRRNHPNY